MPSDISPSDPKYHSLENFAVLHAPQFENMKLPAFLRKITHKKLYAPKFATTEDLFEITRAEEAGFIVSTNKNVRRWADVWLVPHIVFGTAEELYTQIKEDKELLERLWDMMDLSKLIVEEDEEVEKATETKEETKPAIPAGAQEVVEVEADEMMIEIVMSEADVTMERAITALKNSGNDLVAAITECNLHPDFAAAHDEMNKRLFVQYGDLDNVEDKVRIDDASVKAEAAKAKKVLTDDEKHLQRVVTVFNALFQLNYVGCYMTMRTRDENSPYTGAPHPDEIIKNYYVPHEIGSCIGFSNTPNVKMAHFVSLTTNNGWSLLWAEKDIKAGEPLTRLTPTAIPCPFKM